MECFVFLFREQPHSLQGARLTRSGEEILLKVTYYNVGLNGLGFHLGSKDRELERKMSGRQQGDISLILEFLRAVGRKKSPVRN